jgi:hypothetical protein
MPPRSRRLAAGRFIDSGFEGALVADLHHRAIDSIRAKLAVWNCNGCYRTVPFPGSRRGRPLRLKCSVVSCENLLNSQNESGRCKEHRFAKLGENKRKKMPLVKLCTIPGCQNKSKPWDRSGRCETHQDARVFPDGVPVARKGKFCSEAGCGTRLANANRSGLCPEHGKKPTALARVNRAVGTSLPQRATRAVNGRAKPTVLAPAIFPAGSLYQPALDDIERKISALHSLRDQLRIVAASSIGANA